MLEQTLDAALGSYPELALSFSAIILSLNSALIQFMSSKSQPARSLKKNISDAVKYNLQFWKREELLLEE